MARKLRFTAQESIASGGAMSSSAAPQESIYQKVDSMSETELDSLPRGVIQLNAQGTVLQYNAYEEKLTGLTKANVVGKNFLEQVVTCPPEISPLEM
jgi:photoactive yellow protein